MPTSALMSRAICCRLRPSSPPGVIARRRGRVVAAAIDCDHRHGGESVLAGAFQRFIVELAYMLPESTPLGIAHFELLHVADGDGGTVAAQSARQLRAHGDRA